MFKMIGAAVAAIALSWGGAASAAVVMAPFASQYGDAGRLFFHCSTCEQGEPLTFTTATFSGITDLYFDWYTSGLTIDGMVIENAKPFTNVRLWSHTWTSVVGQTAADGSFVFSGSSWDGDFPRYFRLTVGLEEFDVTSFAAHGHALVSNVPEPSTWAMMIVGFGLSGAAIRRRRVKRSACAIYFDKSPARELAHAALGRAS
jgi:hypothetical protein